MTPTQALRSRRGERHAHAPLLRADGSEPGTEARCRAAHTRHSALFVLPARHAPADNPGRGAAPRYRGPAALLPRRPRRPRRTGLRDAEVPHAQARRRGTARALSRGRARPAHAGRDDTGRRLAAQDAAGRNPPADQRAQRGHEPRRPPADQAALLRGARLGATRVLAAPRRAARAHRLRPAPARLRDLDGREARARPRVDRRPLGPALPADAVDDGGANPPPNVHLNVEARVLQVEVAAHPEDDVTADHARAAQVGHGRALGVEQLAPQALIRLGLLLDRAVRLLVEARRESVAPEVVEAPQALGRLARSTILP